ncbi:M48 family metallopeptidase [Flammeovirga kamogawensis]|uniref:M48 family metallopeptidase n=1 Tax=Flammeovirga kamogawensis TaxID=373891 RepID=A0ABX8GVL5_9BACT|nr:M48 family metallopeptidase [Flammeovirga kamogawensis]MBB6464037.1 STE24 endopeptidase [Flammeovirga kamogawensis]QWG07367.1 M48 family metallopeptidase [Flammeovirga kamogawensis]TRX69182.1 M48 family metallopeptidase [Flammeovirga kamogawensis]
MNGDTIFYIIIALLTGEFVLERVLSRLNIKAMSAALPSKLSGLYDKEEYKKSQEYQIEKDNLGLYSSAASYLLTLVLLSTGGYAWIDSFTKEHFDSNTGQILAFFAIVAILSDIISIPFEWKNTFSIEEKYGFNKMTPKTFIIDKIKGYALGGIIGGLLLWGFVAFYSNFPDTYWIIAWVVFMLFALGATMFYANIILPMFNKITPLEDGELRTAIEKYAEGVDFPLGRIMVMDGSKRSTKANAFFSGLGGNKNIVLYDTLIEKLTIDEIVAVLAHEVGHYKRKHTLQMFFISAVNMFITLFILSKFIDSKELAEAMGASKSSAFFGAAQHTLSPLNLVAFSMLYSPISLITGVVVNAFSRKNEFEADAFAKETSSSLALIDALKKLSVDSLSNLTPDENYVKMHYSHPPLLKRMEAMEG